MMDSRSGRAYPKREGGMPTGANIMNTANRREALSKSRELKQAIATAMHLSEMDFGETQSANRSPTPTPWSAASGSICGSTRAC